VHKPHLILIDSLAFMLVFAHIVLFCKSSEFILVMMLIRFQFIIIIIYYAKSYSKYNTHTNTHTQKTSS